MSEPASTDAPRRFRVVPARAGVRLDAFLADALGTSRAEARRLLAAGRVEMDGLPVGPGAKGSPLRAGAELAVASFTPPVERRPWPATDAPLVVLARGGGWIAIDKPAGVGVHPLRDDDHSTVLNALVARHPQVVGVGEGGLRSGVVHRLDVETSGALLFALEEARWRALRDAFRNHQVEKTYRAVVLGRLTGRGEEQLDLFVAQHRPARVRAARSDAERRRGRRTRLRWRALESFDDASLVEVRPLTGFLHQIRATLAALGHPLVGDRVYADPERLGAFGATRHLLHASALRLPGVEVRSPDPPDFAAVLARLRAG